MKFSSTMWSWLRKKKKLITHSGSFHADDVFAAATLSLWLDREGFRYRIIRTRDENRIDTGDYVFDVGNIYDHTQRRYDHHQRGGAGEHHNGIPYAAFGLIWKHYGLEVCQGEERVWQDLEERFVQPLDATDVGVDIFQTNQYGVSPVMLQSVIHWLDASKSSDRQFMAAFQLARTILRNLIDERIERQHAVEEIRELFSLQTDEGDTPIALFDIPSSRHIITEALANLPEASDTLYAIYPNEEFEKWSVLALPQHAGTFDLRQPLPEAWRGLRDEVLQEITGVTTAQFCHPSGFWMFALTKEDAEELGRKSLEE
ncbi:MYG1 family protein [Candidatus Nomurabacteria bacterium]|nr:MYG1 family protein [Candidatus Nomurabacteria bacterium]